MDNPKSEIAKINARYIPISTQQEMYKFFLRTSAPRIAARMLQEQREQEEAVVKERQALVDKDLLESKQDKGEVKP